MECAITRATKEKRVAELTEALEKSDVAFAVRYNKVSVKNFESFRRALPADAKLYVAKNTLMRQAVSRVSHRKALTHCYQKHGCLPVVCTLTAGHTAEILRLTVRCGPVKVCSLCAVGGLIHLKKRMLPSKLRWMAGVASLRQCACLKHLSSGEQALGSGPSAVAEVRAVGACSGKVQKSCLVRMCGC